MLLSIPAEKILGAIPVAPPYLQVSALHPLDLLGPLLQLKLASLLFFQPVKLLVAPGHLHTKHSLHSVRSVLHLEPSVSWTSYGRCRIM